MKAKIKNGYLVLRIPLADLPFEFPVDVRPPKLKPPKAVPFEHTQECMVLRAKEEQFAREWPIHCRTCRAAGFIPAAGGQKRACPRCIEFGLCARCGNSALGKVTTEEGTFYRCPQCEWDQAAAFDGAAEAMGLVSPRWYCVCDKEDEHA